MKEFLAAVGRNFSRSSESNSYKQLLFELLFLANY